MQDTMKDTEPITRFESSFAKEVRSASGVDLYACYQCQKCTNGCPVSFAMDYYPHQIIRMIQLGLTDEISHAKSVWLCASCETCFTRCPNEIDIPTLMDHFKQRIVKQGEKPVESGVAIFHRSFLKNIRRYGRIYEAGLMREYFLKTSIAERKVDLKEMIRYLKLGLNMLKRGRLPLVPEKTGGKKAVKALFKKQDQGAEE
jgi:heterodisulfide reductase subunit C